MIRDRVDSLRALVEALPKAELHVHLEGTITPEFAGVLAYRHDHPLAQQGLPFIRRLYQHTSFNDFLEHLRVVMLLLRQPGDLLELIRHYAGFARSSNIVYAEVQVTPLPLISNHLPYPALMEAIQQGVDEAAGKGLQLRVILDTIRQFGPERFDETLRLHQEYPFPCVVGIGMGGNETAASPELFQSQFERARRAGLHTVVHSGESGGAESVWRTLHCLKPERVLHGIRAVEDESLVRHLAEIGLPLDICPSSNVATHVVACLSEHPIRKLFDAGVRVTLNTDDPSFFDTNLNQEYLRIAEHLGFTAEELFRVAQEGFRASFLSEEQKSQYLQRQQRTWDALQGGKPQ